MSDPQITSVQQAGTPNIETHNTLMLLLQTLDLETKFLMI